MSLSSGVVAMPTFVARRNGNYPVRLSLNITEDVSESLDEMERLTGHSRAVIARNALSRGLPLLLRMWRMRKHRMSIPRDFRQQADDGAVA